MATELASAYLSLIPTIRNAGKQISAQLDGVDVSGSGRKMGKQLSDGVASSLSSDSVSAFENAVAKASANVGRAMNAEKDAATQLAIAEQRLNETSGEGRDHGGQGGRRGGDSGGGGGVRRAGGQGGAGVGRDAQVQADPRLRRA